MDNVNNLGVKNKKSIFKKWWFWAIVIVIVIAIGSSGGDDESIQTVKQTNDTNVTENLETNKSNEDAASKEEKKETENTSVEEDPITIVENVIEEAIGETTNHSDEALKKTIRNAYIEDNQLYLELTANDNLSTNYIKLGILIDSKDIFQSIFTQNKDISAVNISWYFPMVDVKGNTSIDQVVFIEYTKENANTVNWDNILTDNVAVAADNYWEHPAFSN